MTKKSKNRKKEGTPQAILKSLKSVMVSNSPSFYITKSMMDSVTKAYYIDGFKAGLKRALELTPDELSKDIIGLVFEDTSVDLDMLNDIYRDVHNSCRSKIIEAIKKELEEKDA